MTTACLDFQSRVTLVAVSVILMCSLVTVAQAEEVKLTGPQIIQALSEKEVKGNDNGQVSSQIFRSNGATFYAIGQAQQIGNWKVVEDKYCSVWPPSEHWVCYDVFQNGKAIRFHSPSDTSVTYILSE